MTHGRAKHHRRLRTALAVCLVLMVQAGALAAVRYVSTHAELIAEAAACNEDDIIELTANLTRENGQGTAKITANGVTFRSSAGNQFLINNGDDGAGQTIPGRLLEVGDETTP